MSPAFLYPASLAILPTSGIRAAAARRGAGGCGGAILPFFDRPLPFRDVSLSFSGPSRELHGGACLDEVDRPGVDRRL